MRTISVRSIKIEEVEDLRVAVVFDVTGVESDPGGVALTPALFQATDELARQEWISDRGAATQQQRAISSVRIAQILTLGTPNLS
jgi:hypothetical protein